MFGMDNDGTLGGAISAGYLRLQKRYPDEDLDGARYIGSSGVNDPKRQLSEYGYEVRLYNEDSCLVHVGVAVADSEAVDSAYGVMKLPASSYAVFEVYVARGYDSENESMNRWLEENKDKYRQRQLDGRHYVVEFYDERFQGDSPESVVEVWIPLEEVS